MRENHVSLHAETLWVWGGSEFPLELATFFAHRAEGVLQPVRPSGGRQHRSNSGGLPHFLDGFEERF